MKDVLEIFADSHYSKLEKGTTLFQDSDGTKYDELKRFTEFNEPESYTYKGGYHGLINSSKVNRHEVVEFCKALIESNLKVTSILISGSNINDDGAKALAEYIHKTDDLMVLDIHYSYISEAGMENIIEALKANKSIMHLNVRSNEINPAIGDKILDLVTHHNSTIRQIVIVQPNAMPGSSKPSVVVQKEIHDQVIENAQAYISSLSPRI